MHELIELILQLNIGKLYKSEVWSSIMEPGSQMEQLYEAIASESVRSDEEAMLLLYGSTEETSRFQSLKNRFKERIIDIVFLLDFRETAYTDRQKAYFECNKKWAAAMVLLSKNIKITSIDLLERLLKHSTYFEFSEITLNILYSLRLHYGTIEGDSKKYDLYRDQYSVYQKVWMMENEAEELYTHFVSHFVSARAQQDELVATAAEYYQRIKPSMERCDSFRLHLCGRLMELMVYSSQNDYENSARVCLDAIEFFDSKPYNSSLPMQAFYYQLVVCYVQLKQFEEGELVVNKYHHIYEDGSYNWFKLQELFFLLSMHTGHYQRAFSTYDKVVQHPRLSAQPDPIQETWNIFSAFAHYLIRIGEVESEGDSSFRVNKFLNTIPKFSKDKRGMNIPILIAQILFMFAEGKYGQSIDRIEAIQKYCSRYLKRNDTFRSNCFIKMLMQLPDAGFHREAAVRKAEKYLTQLESMPMEISNQAHGVEIIPYEELWQLVLGQLKTGAIRKSKK
jgi:hypothetical protein